MRGDVYALSSYFGSINCLTALARTLVLSLQVSELVIDETGLRVHRSPVRGCMYEISLRDDMPV